MFFKNKKNCGILVFSQLFFERIYFPCYSTWKRRKQSGHFSKFRIIIGNFCSVNQKCYVLKLIDYTFLLEQIIKIFHQDVILAGQV
jgi:hypothetical protein